VIEAIADGRQAAISIARYLNGQNLGLAGHGIEGHHEPQKGKYDRTAGSDGLLTAEKRVKNFNEVQKGFARGSRFRRQRGVFPAEPAVSRLSL